MKFINALAWNVTEPEYRQSPYLSYSTIAKYERSGFDSLATLFDEQSSPSLTFGSVVDELITGTQESFDKRFVIAEFPKLEPSVEEVVRKLYEHYGKSCDNIYNLQEQELKNVMDECEFRKTWTDLKRMEKILTQDSAKFYKLLLASTTQQIIDSYVYKDALACVNALRQSPQTYHYFRENEPDSPIKRYYQLKFKDSIDGIMYRCMIDLLLVDYEHKVVIPCDLKTSSGKEYKFFDSVMKWRYDLQARLYWRILRQLMDKDDFFKDFELKDFRFIVVNKESLQPLIWFWPDTKKDGDLDFGGKILRSPWAIGKELQHYLSDAPAVPDGITMNGMNNIVEWLNKTA